MEKPIMSLRTAPVIYGIGEEGLYRRVKYRHAYEWECVRRWVDADEYKRTLEALQNTDATTIYSKCKQLHSRS